MLVLTRKIGEKLRIGDDITVTVTQVKGNRVKIGIEAPGNVRIVRGELEEVVDHFEMEMSLDELTGSSVMNGRTVVNGAPEDTVIVSHPEVRPVAAPVPSPCR